MAELSERIFFTSYTEDPFASKAFVGMDKVIKEYLPESGKIEKSVSKGMGMSCLWRKA